VVDQLITSLATCFWHLFHTARTPKVTHNRIIRTLYLPWIPVLLTTNVHRPIAVMWSYKSQFCIVLPLPSDSFTLKSPHGIMMRYSQWYCWYSWTNVIPAKNDNKNVIHHTISTDSYMLAPYTSVRRKRKQLLGTRIKNMTSASTNTVKYCQISWFLGILVAWQCANLLNACIITRRYCSLRSMHTVDHLDTSLSCNTRKYKMKNWFNWKVKLVGWLVSWCLTTLEHSRLHRA